MTAPALERLIELALTEDIGSGDVTAEYFVSAGRRALAYAVVRREGVVSGIAVAARVFLSVDAGLHVEPLVEDGTKVAAGVRLMRVAPESRALAAMRCGCRWARTAPRRGRSASPAART